VKLVTLGTIPVALVALHGAWANALPMDQKRFGGYGLRLMGPLATSIMDLEARLRYPQRTAGRKVVMIHAGMPNASEQVEAMDRHVEQMEKLLGCEMTGKVHWVRGGLFGLSRISFWGMALGSDSMENEGELAADGLTTLDRHEVAHGFIESFAGVYKLPTVPLLVEGWAESQSGYKKSRLYHQAAQYLEWDDWVPLSQLIGPEHTDFAGRIYDEGGALVDYVLIKHGGPTFFALYHSSTADTFAAQCQQMLGQGLDDLDASVVKHVENTMTEHGGFDLWQLEEMPCGANVAPDRWTAFVRRYRDATGPRQQIAQGARFTVVRTIRSFAPNTLQAEEQSDFALAGLCASRMVKSNESTHLQLAHPVSTCYIQSDKQQISWVRPPPGETPLQSYKRCLSDIRRAAEECLNPTLGDGRRWTDQGRPATVVELAEFEEDGQPRVRVTMQARARETAKYRSETHTLAADQAFAIIGIETDDGLRFRMDYQQVNGHPVLHKEMAEKKGSDGKTTWEMTIEIKGLELGPVPAEYYTLKSFGIDEAGIVNPDNAFASTIARRDDDFASTPLAKTWPQLLPKWIACWLGFCLSLWLLATVFARRRYGNRRNINPT
jgi:hypothetical protein